MRFKPVFHFINQGDPSAVVAFSLKCHAEQPHAPDPSAVKRNRTETPATLRNLGGAGGSEKGEKASLQRFELLHA